MCVCVYIYIYIYIYIHIIAYMGTYILTIDCTPTHCAILSGNNGNNDCPKKWVKLLIWNGYHVHQRTYMDPTNRLVIKRCPNTTQSQQGAVLFMEITDLISAQDRRRVPVCGLTCLLMDDSYTVVSLFKGIWMTATQLYSTSQTFGHTFSFFEKFTLLYFTFVIFYMVDNTFFV